MTYIQNPNKEENCAFCHALTLPDSDENLIVARGQFCYVILNRYPYTTGHVMVVPYEHLEKIEDLPPETRAEMMELTTRCVRVIKRVYHAQGFNIGANLGSAAGAGIPKHMHFHIVPRWQGDTNYITAIGDTRIMPETLQDTYRRISAAWNETE